MTARTGVISLKGRSVPAKKKCECGDIMDLDVVFKAGKKHHGHFCRSCVRMEQV